MLEVAFETDTAIKVQDQSKGKNANQNLMTDDIREEMEALQYDYNVLAARISEIVIASDEMNMILEEADEATSSLTGDEVRDVLEYFKSNMLIISSRYLNANVRFKALTSFDSQEQPVFFVLN